MSGALGPDGTVECTVCAMPLFPQDRHGDRVMLECANRHALSLRAPADAAVLRAIDAWIARRGAQIHTQRERRANEDGGA